MSEFLKSLLLGLVQGATEFLPVSSSGHLAVLEFFTGIASRAVPLNVCLHVGTLVAICLYYAGNLKEICASIPLILRKRSSAASDKKRESAAYVANIIFADAATFLTALLLYGPTETISSSPGVIGWFLVLTAVMLVLTMFLRARPGTLTRRDAAVIGFFQGIAVLPGISRSGATIFAALLLGAERKEAVRFSFLIAVPVLLGAAVCEVARGAGEIRGNLLLFVPGAMVSFISGWFCLMLLEKITVRRYLPWFAVYLVPAGLSLAVFLG